MARKAQILQTLARLLEQGRGERITTAALAAQAQVSEAALYRHFASKAQMFDGLIDVVETDMLELVEALGDNASGSGVLQVREATIALLSFAEKNRGLTRILTGDALIIEDARLQERVNQLIDRMEAALAHMLRRALLAGELPQGDDIAARVNLLLSFILGCWQRYARSDWRYLPTEHIEQQFAILLG